MIGVVPGVDAEAWFQQVDRGDPFAASLELDNSHIWALSAYTGVRRRSCRGLEVYAQGCREGFYHRAARGVVAQDQVEDCAQVHLLRAQYA